MAGIFELLQSSSDLSDVCYLRSYLQPLIGEVEDIPPHLSEFLDDTIICMEEGYKPPRYVDKSVKFLHSELVDKVVEKILPIESSGSGLRLQEPVQTIGYSRYQSGALRKTPSLTLTLKNQEWEELHNLIGTDLISHILSGQKLSVLVKHHDSYYQVVGHNLARYLRVRPNYRVFKREKITKFKEYKEYLKDYKYILPASRMKKPDVLAKLPPVNRIKMLYCPLIRPKKPLSSKHPLNLAPPEAAKSIVASILGPRSKGKYRNVLEGFFRKFAKKYSRERVYSHLNMYCPLPSGWGNCFEANVNKDFDYEWLFSQNCEWKSVCNFIISLLNKCIPRELLGSKKNLKIFQKSVVMFLKLGTWERVSASALCVNYKFKDVMWIKEYTETANRLLLGKIILWLFNDFIVPVMQNCFYITEKQHDNSSLFFYRKQVWAVILHNSKEELEHSGFFHQITPKQANSLKDYTQFPPAKLRIQPKPSFFRPIMHFKSKISVTDKMKLDGNSLLAGMPQLFKSKLTGRSVAAIDFPDIISRIQAFKEEWRSKDKPNLYFLTMDIAKAFDSVKLPILEDLMSSLKFPTVSAYYKYVQLVPRLFKPPTGNLSKFLRLKFKKLTVDESKYPLFRDILQPSGTINIVTSKNIFYTQDRIKLLENVLKYNVIKFNRQYFIGDKGVPQGLSCSPLLSSLFYSYIEEDAISTVKTVYPDSLLLVVRLHDDYLCMSDSCEVLEYLINILQDAASKHDIHFAKDKITSNFMSDNTAKTEDELNGWVGLNITQDLQVVPHVGPTASRIISFDYLSGKITSSDLRNKLIKLINVALNLLRNRSAAQEEMLEEAVSGLLKLQAERYVVFLKTVRKFYRQTHSAKYISRMIVRVLRHSALLYPSLKSFFRIGVLQFAETFLRCEYNEVGRRLKSYLKKME